MNNDLYNIYDNNNWLKAQTASIKIKKKYLSLIPLIRTKHICKEYLRYFIKHNSLYVRREVARRIDKKYLHIMFNNEHNYIIIEILKRINEKDYSIIELNNGKFSIIKNITK